MNKAFLQGNLGRDPEFRHTNSGDVIGNLSVATSENRKDKETGEWISKTEWHRVVVFSQRVNDHLEKHAAKGLPVLIEGKIVTRKWQDQSGQDRFTTEIEVGRFDGNARVIVKADKDGEPAATGGDYKAKRVAGDAQTSIDLDDEIPF